MKHTDTLNYQRIEAAIHYLVLHAKDQPSLEEVAEKVHLSAFHFQRLFTDWAGISPKAFLQYLTAQALKDRLQEDANLQVAAEAVGLSSSSRVHDLMLKMEGVTPDAYRKMGQSLHMQFGWAESPFGLTLVAQAEKGLCWLAFVPSGQEAEALQEMQAYWAGAHWEEAPEMAAQKITEIFSTPDQATAPLKLWLKGTQFQLKVWEALLRVPFGELCTYQDLAQAIHQPKASRAVGSAVGKNHLAYLIPCHRVIRKQGILGHYRWGAQKKPMMLGWEANQVQLKAAT
ncbi:MAG: methylated-DNA--[protein]-cysteine S-methyltransferase [Bacteroidota bacterium]